MTAIDLNEFIDEMETFRESCPNAETVSVKVEEVLGLLRKVRERDERLLKYANLLGEIKQHYLCDRNVKGFDYREALSPDGRPSYSIDGKKEADYVLNCDKPKGDK